MIHLVEVDHTVPCWALEVEESQKNFVADRTVILARAWLHHKLRPRCFYIYDNDKAVGMGLYHDDPDGNCYDFSQLLIDKHHQRRGYGKATVRLVLDEMRRDGRFPKVITCYVEGNEASKNLLSQFGFRETRKDYDEIIMELDLRGTSCQ